MYNALLEDCAKYAKVAKSAVKKMKKIEEEHKSTLAQLKDAKCEVEELKEELLNAYSKINFLEPEVIQANVKVECITTKKLDSVLSSQKPSMDKIGLGYIGEGSLSGKPRREMKFVLAKDVEKPQIKIPIIEKKDIGPKSKAKGKSLPTNQRGPQVKYFLSPLWHSRAHKTKLLQVSCSQKSQFFACSRKYNKNDKRKAS